MELKLVHNFNRTSVKGGSDIKVFRNRPFFTGKSMKFSSRRDCGILQSRLTLTPSRELIFLLKIYHRVVQWSPNTTTGDTGLPLWHRCVLSFNLSTQTFTCLFTFPLIVVKNPFLKKSYTLRPSTLIWISWGQPKCFHHRSNTTQDEGFGTGRRETRLPVKRKTSSFRRNPYTEIKKGVGWKGISQKRLI